ncbi:hypothetical protein V5E97_21295 [Singulisphaera sp. Ch08]|uniref:Uncharacterized protein n=1 Tax=Singulisphaera sp. Ch08 TaxID=3120278 RepID=A0AAU7C695_9BACT
MSPKRSRRICLLASGLLGGRRRLALGFRIQGPPDRPSSGQPARPTFDEVVVFERMGKEGVACNVWDRLS